MGFSRRHMSSLSSVMLRLPLSSSPTGESSLSSAATLDALLHDFCECKLVVFGLCYLQCMSMMKTIDRYHSCSYNALEADRAFSEIQSNYQEYLKLKARVEVLQRSQRNLLGEDLAPLTTKELEQLEIQLEMSLKQIRSTKTQYVVDQLTYLQRREQALAEINNALIKKLDETNSDQIPLQLPWEAREQVGEYRRIPSQSKGGFFQPLYSNSALHVVGYNPQSSNITNAGQSNHNVNGFLPGWML
ncbi:Alpha-glucosidase 2 [Dionaea muscipula]